MKKSLLLGFILNIFFNFLYGQLNPENGTINNQPISELYHEDNLLLPLPNSDYARIVALGSDRLREVYNKKLNNGVDGSPYLYDSWNNHSKIFFRDKTYEIKSFNYNIYADRFEAKLSSDSVFVINSWNVKKVLINDRVFNQFMDPETKSNSYFEDLIDFDNYRILRKYSVKIKSGAVNPLTNEKLANDELVKYETFYIYNNANNNLDKVKLKKSSIESLFKKESINDLNKFIKANRLKYNDINEIIKIVKYYNTL